MTDTIEEVRRYPLATKTGIHLFGWFLEAYRVWDGLTPAQRRAVLSGDTTGAHIRVRATLRARELTDDTDTLTPWGRWVVHARDASQYAGEHGVTEEGALAWFGPEAAS